MFRILLVITAFTALMLNAQEINPNGYYIVKKSVKVMEAPSKTAKVVGKRSYRQKVYIEEIIGEWARIERYESKKLADGSKPSSWVLLKDLSIEQPELPKSKYEINAINEQIVRSTDDGARYFLLYVEKVGKNFITINSRIGPKITGYTKMEIDCQLMKYRELGYTERHLEYFNGSSDKPSNWSNLVSGSSKSDTVQYVCGTRGK